MLRKFRRRPSPAMAVAFVALLAALSGTAVALPGKNSVKADDIARNAVNSADIKNRTIRGVDVRNNTLGGRQINEALLGTVPSANTANTANTANSAGTAGTANLANNIAAPEGFRQVGTAGNPSFGADCGPLVLPAPNPDLFHRPAFFKDREGMVHLRGAVECTGSTTIAFEMPPGYRPANGKVDAWITISNGDDGDGQVVIAGAGISSGGTTISDGAVIIEGPQQVLNGISFRAEG